MWLYSYFHCRVLLVHLMFSEIWRLFPLQTACLAFCPGWVRGSHCLAAQAQPFAHDTFYCKRSEFSEKLLLIRPEHLWSEKCPVAPCTCSARSCACIESVPLNSSCMSSLCNAATAYPIYSHCVINIKQLQELEDI